MSRKRPNMPRVLIRTSVTAWVLGFSMLGATGVVVGPTTAAAEPASSQAAVPLIYYKGRNFRIPITLPAALAEPHQRGEPPGFGELRIQVATRQQDVPGPSDVQLSILARWRVLVRGPDADRGWPALAQSGRLDGGAESESRSSTRSLRRCSWNRTAGGGAGRPFAGMRRTSTWIPSRWCWSIRSKAWACGGACRSRDRSSSARSRGTPARPKP